MLGLKDPTHNFFFQKSLSHPQMTPKTHLERHVGRPERESRLDFFSFFGSQRPSNKFLQTEFRIRIHETGLLTFPIQIKLSKKTSYEKNIWSTLYAVTLKKGNEMIFPFFQFIYLAREINLSSINK